MYPAVELVRHIRIPTNTVQPTAGYWAVVGEVRLVKLMGVERVENAALPMCLFPSPGAPGEAPCVLGEAVLVPRNPAEVARVHTEDGVPVPGPRGQKLARVEALRGLVARREVQRVQVEPTRLPSKRQPGRLAWQDLLPTHLAELRQEGFPYEETEPCSPHIPERASTPRAAEGCAIPLRRVCVSERSRKSRSRIKALT